MRRWSLAGVVVLTVLVAGAASSAGAIVPDRSGGVGLARCVKALRGLGTGGLARAAAGSADPTVISNFAVFRRHRSAADRLTARDLGTQLAAAGARTYDPSAAVHLLGSGARSAVYAVPATIARPTVPAGCAGRPRFGGVRAYLAMRTDQIGSGPGACLISTLVIPGGRTSPLPGKTRPRPMRVVAGAQCESEAVLSGYVGALGDQDLGLTQRHGLIPDGISSITYTLSDGRAFTAPVAGNLVTEPAALSRPVTVRHLTASRLKRLLTARLPTTVTETGPGGQPVASLARPASLITDIVGGYSFLRKLLKLSSTKTSSGMSSTSASCSARTHHCVAVTVTMGCSSERHCHISRAIHRYRYVTARPPAGTTGPNRQPTGPVVARITRFIARPGRLSLVLRGAPDHRVTVLLAVSCFARDSATSSGGPPLTVSVPSRTTIPLPGRARAFRGCDVGAIVVARGHRPVHATIARG
jgi:hypothetical protein